jgi:hypothetical protein
MLDDDKRRSRLRRFGQAQDRQEKWLAAVRKDASDDFRYLMAIEDRKWKRDFIFHVVMGGRDGGRWDFQDYFCPMWKEMSDGVAFVKDLGEQPIGLFWNLVIKRDCVLEIDTGERYVADEFEEWARVRRKQSEEGW